MNAAIATLLAALAALILTAGGQARPHQVCTHWIGVISTVPGTGHGHSGRICSAWKLVP